MQITIQHLAKVLSEIEIHHKRAALAELARMEGEFVDRKEHRVSGLEAATFPEQVLAAIFQQASAEERGVLGKMAQQLSGRVLSSDEPDAGTERNQGK